MIGLGGFGFFSVGKVEKRTVVIVKNKDGCRFLSLTK